MKKPFIFILTACLLLCALTACGRTRTDVTLPEPPDPDLSVHYVQVGSYRNPAYANRLLNELQEQNYTASLVEEDGFFRVRVGSFGTLEDAVEMEQRLKQAGYPTVIIG